MKLISQQIISRGLWICWRAAAAKWKMSRQRVLLSLSETEKRINLCWIGRFLQIVKNLWNWTSLRLDVRSRTTIDWGDSFKYASNKQKSARGEFIQCHHWSRAINYSVMSSVQRSSRHGNRCFAARGSNSEFRMHLSWCNARKLNCTELFDWIV